MNNIQKRFLLFLFGCIPTRLFITYLAKHFSGNALKILGYVAFIIAFSFLYLFFTGKRKTGMETFGDKIWWNNLRPIHAAFYLLFAYGAVRGLRSAWKYLLYDVIFGLLAFLAFHLYNDDFKKLLK